MTQQLCGLKTPNLHYKLFNKDFSTNFFLNCLIILSIKGFTFPAMNVMIASWSPPDERSTISSIAYSGN